MQLHNAIEQQEVEEAIEQELEIEFLPPSLSEKSWSHAKWRLRQPWRLWRLQSLQS